MISINFLFLERILNIKYLKNRNLNYKILKANHRIIIINKNYLNLKEFYFKIRTTNVQDHAHYNTEILKNL